MNKLNFYQKLVKILLSIVAGSILFFMQTNSSLANEFRPTISFWDNQQKGANIFNAEVNLEDIRAAKEYGIKFIRLAPDKFKTLKRDFLIGNADDYLGLIQEDLKKLRAILDICYSEKMPVVISMLSLPGSRWKQNNHDKDDLRIWKSEKYQLQAARFWRDLASELKGHPAIAGYNILNEPHPERLFATKEIHLNSVHQEEVQEMLYTLYNVIIKSIRSNDQDTPIILDSSAYSDAKTFIRLKPHDDKNTIYSFHMYEPYEYTNLKMNQGKFTYPDKIGSKEWNLKALEDYMQPALDFQKKHNIPSNRILVGEFGGNRASPGLEKYFEDLITIFNKQKWHFAFYAFREDTWEGMDYELGSKKLPGSYWQAVERGQKPVLERKSTYPAFDVLIKALDE